MAAMQTTEKLTKMSETWFGFRVVLHEGSWSSLVPGLQPNGAGRGGCEGAQRVQRQQGWNSPAQLGGARGGEEGISCLPPVT